MRFLLVTKPCESLVLEGNLLPATVPLKDVNWEREVVLVVDMGQQRTGGYSVKVANLHLYDTDQIDLSLHVTRPAPGMMAMQVVTHPYTTCRIPRVGLAQGEILVRAADQSGAEIARQVVTL